MEQEREEKLREPRAEKVSSLGPQNIERLKSWTIEMHTIMRSQKEKVGIAFSSLNNEIEDQKHNQQQESENRETKSRSGGKGEKILEIYEGW
jgi:hypothetical protein